LLHILQLLFGQWSSLGIIANQYIGRIVSSFFGRMGGRELLPRNIMLMNFSIWSLV